VVKHSAKEQRQNVRRAVIENTTKEQRDQIRRRIKKGLKD
jgi:hypothetical protein